jgi:hypothetical protein
MRWLRLQMTTDREVRETQDRREVRRDRHAVRPELEGCERRLLLSTGLGSRNQGEIISSDIYF